MGWLECFALALALLFTQLTHSGFVFDGHQETTIASAEADSQCDQSEVPHAPSGGGGVHGCPTPSPHGVDCTLSGGLSRYVGSPGCRVAIARPSPFGSIRLSLDPPPPRPLV